MIFQDPRAGINPMRTLGDHLTEGLRLGEGWSASDARARAIELLHAVRLPRPEEHLRQYPHEFSGGMLQRVMIAGALAGSPQLLVCDEPTTALDVTTQAEIISVLTEQRAARGMGMLFITHDLNLAASICDRVYVMSAGRIVEEGDARQVFLHPRAEYTQRLVAATPTLGGRVGEADEQMRSRWVADARAWRRTRPAARCWTCDRCRRPTIRAARNRCGPCWTRRSLFQRARRSAWSASPGSGKSTLARMIVGLEHPDAGDIRIDGVERTTRPRGRAERLAHAQSVQMVFQDPYLSLDPRIPPGRRSRTRCACTRR